MVLPGFGPTGFLSSYFLNPTNLLLALGLLIPLILLYLIRPKPANVAVPSLMFILNDMGKSNVHRFFRTIFRDLLFILQALAIILLGLALAKPFINVSEESLVKQSIIVIDASASTRAFGDDRFEQIRAAALEELTADNIVIVARANPAVLDVNANPKLGRGDAEELIDDLQPTDTIGDLPSALDLASQFVGPDSKVTVVSDLVLSTLESEELIEAKLKVLRSKGALTEVRLISGPGQNAGIIDAALNSQNATLDLKIQNFDDKPREVGLEYNGEAVALPKNLLEPDGKPGSLLTVSVPLAHGRSEFRLTPDDDFDVDNHYYVSIPDLERINVLVISNDANVQASKLIPALNAAGDQFTKVNVAYGIPPKVPDLDHQVYIIKDVNPEFLLPGVIKELQDKVEAGAVLVVFAQPGLFGIDMQSLLPVMPKANAQPLGGRQEIIVNGSMGLLRGLSDIGQANGDQLLRVGKTTDAAVHAYVITNEGQEPVIAHKRVGKGVVLYYGIRDQRAIDLDPQSYAIIWGRIIDYSLPDIRVLNIGTGSMINSATKNVQAPSGRMTTPALAAESGFYSTGQTVLAANLYPLHTGAATKATNVKYESTISKSANVSTTDIEGKAGEGEESKVPKDLSEYLIIAGLVLMLLELLYVKFRGDL
jgi:hypothetical protein